MTIMGFGFGDATPSPCSEDRARYARAIIDMINADAELDTAKARLPSYTGQWDSHDYYANEQEQWYRAADELAEAASALEK